LVAMRFTQLEVALLNGLHSVFELWHLEALVLSDLFAADFWKKDWTVHALLDRFRIRDGDVIMDGVNHRNIVLGGLGNFLTVWFVSISVTAWCADGDVLNIFLLLEVDLEGLGSGLLILVVVVEGADLVGDAPDGLRADGPDHVVAALAVNDLLDGQVNLLADLLEVRSAHFSNVLHFHNGAVVLGLHIQRFGAQRHMTIRWGRLVVHWHMAASWKG